MKIIVRLTFLFFVISFVNCSKEYSEYINEESKHSFTLEKNISWSSPEGIELTMDIYIPNTGKNSYPVIAMFHGGAWMSNSKEIMSEPASYLASQSEYIICNIDYRLLPQRNNSIKINEIIEDAFGAVLWIKSNIHEYKGDPEKIIVTGDSAGGHLASMVLTNGDNLSSVGFEEGNLSFTPSWLPPGMSAEDVKNSDWLCVQAGIINYGAVSLYDMVKYDKFEEPNIFWIGAKTKARGIFGNNINVNNNPEYYKAISPLFTVPDKDKRALPPILLTVGSEDEIITPNMVVKYRDIILAAGHTRVEYWVHNGRPHGFLNSGSSILLGTDFKKDAVPALKKMISFLNRIFY
ncbi:Acetyl esterase/lipase [Arenibacter palladensis]|uniref:Acetyl esterase/lipase n=1 Tax=Arenibacter palladensis TaxID=237373 RepID=A0A1M4Y0X2_9FLAO|nr:alpha/beta hydrolase [Arenibacter palladensis]SHE99339.1 Acetyl esterase/lipase [Arenibacter palladensis]